MFTGIITDIGRIKAASPTSHGEGEGRRFEIETAYDTASIDIGASISCSGACMTVVEKNANTFTIEVSAESLSKTTLADWAEGKSVNLERALCLGDELGGHLVSGHVDGIGNIAAVREDGDSKRLAIEIDEDLAPFVASKGSITIDGVSLTVNEVRPGSFGVNIIPHTQTATTLGGLEINDKVNLEIDLLARYVARLLNKD